MKPTLAKDYRSKSVDELKTELAKERAGLYKARRDLVFRQLTDTSSLKVRRKNIARILTVMAEKNKGASA